MSDEGDADRRSPGPSWEIRYARRLVSTDLVVVVWAVVGAQIARFGFDPAPPVLIDARRRFEFDITMSYTVLSALLIAAWMLCLALVGSRDSRVVGVGAVEYRRVIDAALRLFGSLAILAFLLRVDIARAYLLVAFPIGTLALLWTRWLWRQWLVAQRERGQFSARVVLLGSYESATEVARSLARAPGAGYRVVAMVTTDPAASQDDVGTAIPVSHDIGRVDRVMLERDADTLVVTSSNDLPPQRIRELSWALEPGRQHLVVTPSLTDVGGPRILTRPVAGLPLLHVETPRYDGMKRVVKRAFDIVASGALIVLTAPLLLAIAAAVRLSTPGDVLFRQERIGWRGEPFAMLKFRSMVVDAEDRLADLQAQSEGNGVLFKMKADPRVTTVGRFLRRYSLDELPQLFNVFAGSMSLVGPRPPLRREVSAYDGHVHRKFLVKPGITGLWQVSGRSDLSWEESVRLDLYYVENWSLTSDLVILWRTARAVLARRGAY